MRRWNAALVLGLSLSGDFMLGHVVLLVCDLGHVAHCHLGLGKLYRRTGKREQTQEHLTVATTMYRDMDMRFWLEQAEAEMRELG